MPQPRNLAFVLAAVCSLLAAPSARPATWTAEAVATFERTTEVQADGISHEETFDQSYTLTYATFLFPTLEFTFDFTLDVEQSDTEDVDGVELRERETSPAVEASLVSTWWDLFGSWDETRTTSSAPGEGAVSEVEWEFEVVAEPEHHLLPAFGFNYTGGNDDVAETDLELGIEYVFLDMVDFTLGYSLETLDEPEPDSDERGWTIESELSITRELTRSLSFEADWSHDRDHAELLDDSGGTLDREDTLSNDVRALLGWNVLDLLELTLEKEVEWDKDLEQDTLEVTDTWIGEAEYDQDLTDTIHLNLSYTDEREESRPIGPHTYTITRDYTAEFEFAPFDFFNITPSFDRSDTVEWSRGPGAETEDTIEDAYEIAFDYALWADLGEVSVTRTWDITKEHGKTTTEERSWDLETTFSLFRVPNLELTPEYTYTRDDDLIAGTIDEEESIQMEIDYLISLNDVLVFELSHTYERTQEWPAEASMSVERTDDTELVLSWNEFLIGHNLELSMTREASDTSNDDLGPEVDYTYSFIYDWEILTFYVLSFEYNHDKKSDDTDTRDFNTTFSADLHDGRITLDFEHEFEEDLEDDREKTHRYLIEIQGQF